MASNRNYNLRRASGGFRTPYTITFTGRSNGPLPYPWIGTTFSISSNVAINTATLGSELLTDPGLEANYTAGLCDTLTSSGSPTVAQSADVHGGSKAQSFVATTNADYLRVSGGAGVANAWYLVSCWGKRTVGTSGTSKLTFYQASALPSSGDYCNYTSAVYAQSKTSLISTGTGTIFVYPIRDQGSSAWDTVIVDDMSLKRITASTLTAMLPFVARNATVKIQPATATDGTISAAIAWGNNIMSPTTYLLAGWKILGPYFIVFLLKNVAGTWTTLVDETGVTEVVDAWLEIRPVDNDTVGLYYNNTQVGTNQDVTDVLGNIPGLLITGGNTVKGFFVG